MPPDVAPPPCWLDEASLRHLRMACADGQDPQRMAAELRDIIWSRYPALPLTAIEEAASFIRPDPVRARNTRSRFLAARLARIAARFRPPP